MIQTALIDCPRCDATTNARLIYRDFTTEGDVEVWECETCGFKEQS